MRNTNYDWCFEGGCTYGADAVATLDKDEPDIRELEEMYREPCIAMFD